MNGVNLLIVFYGCLREMAVSRVSGLQHSSHIDPQTEKAISQ